ncbi:MAG: TRAP transporter small permease [Casimicrobiaceae bacterium]|nr:TRAP transporter small permease [Casimicrobiaceae bacterium]MCX8098588.1 TRAP transporter small permease [Casimicrobiaceae bacterium]
MAHWLLKLNDRLYRVCVWVSGLSIAAMSLIIPWGIFTRYVLGTGSQWPEPIAIQLMVLFTFLGAAAAYRAQAHIAVELLRERLPPRANRVIGVVVQLAILALALFAVVYGVRLCAKTWHQYIGQLPWLRVGATYLPVPIGGAITASFVLETLLFGPQSKRAMLGLATDSASASEERS